MVEDVDIKAVVEASGSKLVKVIIETCLLTDEEKVEACQLANWQVPDFVKTSTGFSTGGATIEDIELMREAVGPIWESRHLVGHITIRRLTHQKLVQPVLCCGVAIVKGESHDSY